MKRQHSESNDSTEPKSSEKKCCTFDDNLMESLNGRLIEKIEGKQNFENTNGEPFSVALTPNGALQSTTVQLESKLATTTVQSDEMDETVAETKTEYAVISSNAQKQDTTSSQEKYNPLILDDELRLMKSFPKYEEVIREVRPIVLPEKSSNAPKICLVLDLDETLVSCTRFKRGNWHMEFEVPSDDDLNTVYVRKRPHMEYFLKRVSKIFEIVVFTASEKVYAQKLIDLLDPDGSLIKHRLFRGDCLKVNGIYVKDLNILGRDLSKVVLVDNAAYVFAYQVNNGIPITIWLAEENDTELLSLLPFLESLVDVDDVRPIVEKKFQLQERINKCEDRRLLPFM